MSPTEAERRRAKRWERTARDHGRPASATSSSLIATYTAMYEFQGIDFGPTEVTVEDDTLRGALDQMGQLYNLHKDALFLEAHVQFFHDVEPEVVPRSRDDNEGYQYRGFECLRTGCNVTFKEKEEKDGIFPGRFAAYRNGDDNPKLYDPKYDPQEILEMVDTDTPFIRRFGVDIGHDGQHRRQSPSRGQTANGSESASNPSGAPEASSTRQNGGRQKHESEKVYDQSSQETSNQQGPSAQQAATALLGKIEAEPDGQLAGDTSVNGTDLADKLMGLAEYAGRDKGYVRRLVDALGVTSLSEVAVGQAQDAVAMILDEETLRQNENFEPDDQLPF